jgi:hypothetical protein
MGSRLASWLPAALLLVVSPIAVGWAGLRPPADGEAVAAVFPPWWSAGEALAAAATVGPVVREGIVPTLLVVRTPAATGAARLRAAGAFLVLDPQAIGGCFKE